MAKVVITKGLHSEISKKFKQQSIEIFELLKTLEVSPQKGKVIGHVAGIAIKEIKYKTYRFYCMTNGSILKFGSQEELAALIIKFVRMSSKKNQQEVIDGIKKILKSLGFDGL